MKDITEIIKSPIVTEKGTMLKEDGNKVLFAVDRNANKIEIRKAVEKLFGVKVEDVQTLNVKGKSKRYGRYDYRRSDWKKAIVTLKEGDSIEMIEGV